jgi:hypothetical protein
VKIFIDERDFTRWVLKEARARYWLAAHPGNIQLRRRPGGESFPVADKDAAGLPDLILVHANFGIVWAELKMPDKAGRLGRLRDEQVIWLQTLREAGERVYVWGPSDQREIEDILDGAAASKSRLFDEAEL